MDFETALAGFSLAPPQGADGAEPSPPVAPPITETDEATPSPQVVRSPAPPDRTPDPLPPAPTPASSRGAVVQPPLGGLEAYMPEDYHPSPNVLSDEVVDQITEAARACVRRADAREAEEGEARRRRLAECEAASPRAPPPKRREIRADAKKLAEHATKK